MRHLLPSTITLIACVACCGAATSRASEELTRPRALPESIEELHRLATDSSTSGAHVAKELASLSRQKWPAFHTDAHDKRVGTSKKQRVAIGEAATIRAAFLKLCPPLARTASGWRGKEFAGAIQSLERLSTSISASRGYGNLLLSIHLDRLIAALVMENLAKEEVRATSDALSGVLGRIRKRLDSIDVEQLRLLVELETGAVVKCKVKGRINEENLSALVIATEPGKGIKKGIDKDGLAEAVWKTGCDSGQGSNWVYAKWNMKNASIKSFVWNSFLACKLLAYAELGLACVSARHKKLDDGKEVLAAIGKNSEGKTQMWGKNMPISTSEMKAAISRATRGRLLSSAMLAFKD